MPRAAPQQPEAGSQIRGAAGHLDQSWEAASGGVHAPDGPCLLLDACSGRRLAEKGGFQDGLEQGLRGTVRSLAEVLGLSITAKRNKELAQMSADQLSSLVETLKKQRRWP